ncbi:MAG: hypothetical protein AAF721_40380 [Myxococcota bacterium]
MVWSAAAIACVAVVGGCAEDGDDPATWGLQRYVHHDGAFELEFLSPPWEVLHVEPGLRLRIAPEVFGFDVYIAASTHGLDVAHVSAADQIADLQGPQRLMPAQMAMLSHSGFSSSNFKFADRVSYSF